MKARILTAAAVLAVAATPAFAQRAPRETVNTTIGGKKLAIEYGRPALKGRTVDQLTKDLPADRVWRTGVDQVTTLTVDGDVTIGGKKVPAGKYTVYLHSSDKGEWSFILNSDQGVPLKTIFAGASPEMADAPWPHMGDYTKAIADKEVVRAAMKKDATTAPAEMFTIALAPGKNGAVLRMAWGDQSWSLDVTAAK